MIRFRLNLLLVLILLVGSALVVAGCPSQKDVKAEKAKKAEAAGTDAFETGDFDKAITQLEEAAENAPEDPEILRKLGLSYEAKGRLDEALAQYRESLVQDPEQVEVLYKVAIIRKTQGDTAGAVEDLNKALEVNDEFVAARLILGEIYTAQGETDKAKSEYEAVIALNPFGVDIKDVKAKLADLE